MDNPWYGNQLWTWWIYVLYEGTDILPDVLATLKEWVCWLFNVVANYLTNWFIVVVDMLPRNTIDPEVLQTGANYVFALNEVLPIVEWCGMFGFYLAWRATLAAIARVVWLTPSIGG